jgi:hypothetical protein
MDITTIIIGMVIMAGIIGTQDGITIIIPFGDITEIIHTTEAYMDVDRII